MFQIFKVYNVILVGYGEKLVVLGNGFGIDQFVWKYVVFYFVDDFKFIFFDSMGDGIMDFEYFDCSVQWYFFLYGYVDDLFVILDELEVDLCIYIGYFVVGMVGCLVFVECLEFFFKIVMIFFFLRWFIFFLF